MIPTVKATFRTHGALRRTGRITTPDFDYFIVQEGSDNAAQRRRYRLLLEYACRECLTPAEQQVVQWRYREGKTLTAASKTSGIPISTLSRRCRTARLKLLRFAEQAAAVQQIVKASEREDSPLN